jgi:hypothetical protein
MTAEVEAVSVAPAQPEGDVSSTGRSESQEVRAESWVPRGARQKLARRLKIGP